jgi:hypothetical protein
MRSRVAPTQALTLQSPLSWTKQWQRTGKGWFTLCRFYGPLGPFFEKSWSRMTS